MASSPWGFYFVCNSNRKEHSSENKSVRFTPSGKPLINKGIQLLK
jgi:hypothetical protein